MKKLIADVLTKADGGIRRRYYCEDAHGHLDGPVTHTLLMLVSESLPPSDVELESLVAEARNGDYMSPNAALPDWGVNDKNVWLTPPWRCQGASAFQMNTWKSIQSKMAVTLSSSPMSSSSSLFRTGDSSERYWKAKGLSAGLEDGTRRGSQGNDIDSLIRLP